MDFKRLQITLNKEEFFFVCLICFVFFFTEGVSVTCSKLNSRFSALQNLNQISKLAGDVYCK